MINEETKRQKITLFLNDEMMSESIKEELREAFLTSKSEESVESKAARMMAIEMLETGWKRLQTLKNKGQNEQKDRQQVGL